LTYSINYIVYDTKIYNIRNLLIYNLTSHEFYNVNNYLKFGEWVRRKNIRYLKTLNTQ